MVSLLVVKSTNPDSSPRPDIGAPLFPKLFSSVLTLLFQWYDLSVDYEVLIGVYRVYRVSVCARYGNL